MKVMIIVNGWEKEFDIGPEIYAGGGFYIDWPPPVSVTPFESAMQKPAGDKIFVKYGGKLNGVPYFYG